MGTVQVSSNIDTSTVNTSKSTKTHLGKLNSKGNTVNSDFTKLLAGKSTEEKCSSISIKDCINELTTLISNLGATLPKVDKLNGTKDIIENKEETISSTTTEIVKTGDKANDLIALLSSLLNQLTTKTQSKDLTLKLENSSKENPVETTKVDLVSRLIAQMETKTVETNKVDLISKLVAQLETKLPEQEYQFSEVKQTNGEILGGTLNSLELIKESDNKDKIQSIKNLINSKIITKDPKEVMQNKTTIQMPMLATEDNTVTEIKAVKEIKNVIGEILESVKAEGLNSNVKDQDVKKIEVILKNFTQLVDNLEKQVTLKKSTDDVQTFVKPQLIINNTQNSDTQNSKTNTDADKLLQKIAQPDSSDKTQSFANLVTRASNQNDLATTKLVDNVVISKENITTDVIKTVKYMNVNDIKDLTVKITPKDLGEVVVKLTQEGNVMKATITTSNKEAYQLINSNLQEINDKISSNNTSIHNFSVDVFNGDSAFFKQGSEQNKESNQGKKRNNSLFEEQDQTSIESIEYKDSNVNILV